MLAGPLVGLVSSAVALFVGLQMTAAAGPDALAGTMRFRSMYLYSFAIVVVVVVVLVLVVVVVIACVLD